MTPALPSVSWRRPSVSGSRYLESPRRSSVLFRFLIFCCFASVPAGFLFAVIGGVEGDQLYSQMFRLIVTAAAAALGLFPIRRVWEWEAGAGFYRLPIAAVCLGMQHCAFAGGGLVAAVSDLNYVYSNRQGTFPWLGALVPLELCNLAAIYAATAAIWFVIARSRSTVRPAADAKRGVDLESPATRSLLRSICVVSLLFETVKFVEPFSHLSKVPEYIYHAMAPYMDVTFLFWGCCWRIMGGRRWMFACYVALFSLGNLAAGNRGVFVQPLTFWIFGLAVAGVTARLKPRQLIIGLLFAGLVSVFFVRSEDARTIYGRDLTVSSDVWQKRIDILLEGSGKNASPKLDKNGANQNALFRVGARLCELSTLDLIGRTPRDIAYAGWSDEDWNLLFVTILPVGLSPDSDFFKSEDAGILFLRRYGWDIDPFMAGGNAMPATILGDSWRRFGWIGVIVISLLWGLVLGTVSYWSAARQTNVLVFVFGGVLLVILGTSYSSDVVTLASGLPRRVALGLLYAVIVIGVARAAAAPRTPAHASAG